MGVCFCYLQTCNSVVNMKIVGLVLGQNLIVICHYMQKYLPFIIVLEDEKFFELKRGDIGMV